MSKDTTIKETLWSRFTDWLAGTWLAKAWSTVTSWFSSSDEKKASGSSQPATVITPAKSEGNGYEHAAHKIDYSSNSVAVGIFEQEISGAKKFVLDVSSVHNGMTTEKKQQTIDLINSAGEGAIFVAQVGNKEIKMTCKVSGDVMIVESMLDSNNRKIGIEEIQEYSISRIYTNAGCPGQGQKCNAYIRTSSNGLLLAVDENSDKHSLVKNNQNPANAEEYLVHIKCAKGTLLITGSITSPCNIDGADKKIFFPIKSVTQGSTVYDNLSGMKDLLGFKKEAKRVTVTIISKDQIKPKVETPTPNKGKEEIPAQGPSQEEQRPIVPTGQIETVSNATTACGKVEDITIECNSSFGGKDSFVFIMEPAHNSGITTLQEEWKQIINFIRNNSEKCIYANVEGVGQIIMRCKVNNAEITVRTMHAFNDETLTRENLVSLRISKISTKPIPQALDAEDQASTTPAVGMPEQQRDKEDVFFAKDSMEPKSQLEVNAKTASSKTTNLNKSLESLSKAVVSYIAALNERNLYFSLILSDLLAKNSMEIGKSLMRMGSPSSQAGGTKSEQHVTENSRQPALNTGNSRL